MSLRSKLVGLASGLIVAFSASFVQAEVLFWSTQAKPVEEAQAMREQVLSGFSGSVVYQPNDGGPWLTRLQAELRAGSGSISLLGALHGDFSAMNPDDLVDLNGLGVDIRPLRQIRQRLFIGCHDVTGLHPRYVLHIARTKLRQFI